jgi:uncharacterized spore protein YtfJ
MTNLVERIAESVSAMSVKAAYGDPVTLDGVEFVPVSLVWFGFGGGEGEDESEGAGSGGGGGGASIPIGAYVTTDQGIRFQPNLIALLAVGIPFAWIAGKSLARLVRALKK